MGKTKKDDDKNDTLTRIVLITAIFNLIKSLVDIVDKLLS